MRVNGFLPYINSFDDAYTVCGLLGLLTFTHIAHIPHVRSKSRRRAKEDKAGECCSDEIIFLVLVVEV